MKNLTESFKSFYEIIIKLRSEGGCPWDREQTAGSLKTNLLEETYECIEAISENDDLHTAEELGDILLLVAMIGRIKEEEGVFTFTDVIDGISEKLIRRHPHVFSDAVADTSEEVKKNWEIIKQTIENKNREKSLLDGVSKSIPPLERAYRFQKKASKAGFDWNNNKDIWKKVKEEINELEDEIISGEENAKIEEEFGDVLFSLVNAARFLKIDPAIALHHTNEKFLRRFKIVEKGMKEIDVPMIQENLDVMDSIWNRAKSAEK
ncbi:MAG: nucleoside triphosphate pyrophosphohydrolase [Spirochaetia bacterium]|nr:nucleoside triphosphate pyrophosphohydrolase [Spirochaetia bacterium]